MPRTRPASFRSTSIPLWDSTTTTCAPLDRRLVHGLLERLLPDAERPRGHEVAGIRDRRVGEGLPDDRHGHPVHRPDHVPREDRVLEVRGPDVLGHEVDLALEVLLHDLRHALGAVRELPVSRHDVHAEELRRVDHVLAAGPERRRRALPGVAAVEQQRAGAARPEALDQRGQVREPADLAVGPGGPREVQMGEGVGLSRARVGGRTAGAAARRRGAGGWPAPSPTPRFTLGSRK